MISGAGARGKSSLGRCCRTSLCRSSRSRFCDSFSALRSLPASFSSNLRRAARIRSSRDWDSRSDLRDTKEKALSRLVREEGVVAAFSAERLVSLRGRLGLVERLDLVDLMERFVREGLVSLGTRPRSEAVWDWDSGVGGIWGVEPMETLRLVRKPWPSLKSSSSTSLLSLASSSLDDGAYEGPSGGV